MGENTGQRRFVFLTQCYKILMKPPTFPNLNIVMKFMYYIVLSREEVMGMGCKIVFDWVQVSLPRLDKQQRAMKAYVVNESL